MAGQFRNWFGTLNNPNAADIVRWTALLADGHRKIRYFCFQTEFETVLHYQWYCEFKVAIRLGGVKRILGQRIHADRRRGTQLQAREYVKKVRTRVVGGLSGEWGTPKRISPGKKDFDNAVKGLLEGTLNLVDLREDYSSAYVLHKDKLLDFAMELKGKRHWAMNVQIFVGPSGTGKSCTADEENPNAFNAPWPMGQRWWWPGYIGQECVILDEFRHQIKMDVMLKMFDRYAWTIESKGRCFSFTSKKIVITTNIDPCDWYPNLSLETKAPLARRINEFCKIYDFTPGRVHMPQNQEGGFEKTLRTGDFEFNIHERLNFHV